jgi:hypothetical protein
MRLSSAVSSSSDSPYVARKLQQIEAHFASVRKTEADLAARWG